MTMKRGGNVIVLVSPPSECEKNAILVRNEVLLFTPTLSVGVSRIFESVCLFVCLSVCLFVRSITQKRIFPKCSNLV